MANRLALDQLFLGNCSCASSDLLSCLRLRFVKMGTFLILLLGKCTNHSVSIVFEKYILSIFGHLSLFSSILTFRWLINNLSVLGVPKHRKKKKLDP